MNAVGTDPVERRIEVDTAISRRISRRGNARQQGAGVLALSPLLASIAAGCASLSFPVPKASPVCLIGFL